MYSNLYPPSTNLLARFTCFKFIKISILFSLLCAYNAFGKERFDLLLAGGALKTCSSLSPKNCDKKMDFSGGKTQTFYDVSKKSHQRFQLTVAYKNLKQSEKSKIDSKLAHIYAQGERRLTYADLDDLLSLRAMNDSAYYALLDTQEAKQDKVEVVSLANSVLQSSRAIYSAFYEQAALRANGSVPTILVVTASARDPFEAIGFYEGVFRQLGAKVQWLPLTPSYQQAVAEKQEGLAGCDRLTALHAKSNLFDRARLYPEQVKMEQQACLNSSGVSELIKQAQGIFFNGGDQSKTLAALLTPDGAPSAELVTIETQMRAGQLIVGGTSAGTAVQAGGFSDGYPVPMLTDGSSDNVMQRGVFAYEAPSERCSSSAHCQKSLQPGDVTVRASGGTGLFSLGLLDTHFSQRQRQTRLIAATEFAGQRWGFGVDETTALLVGYDPQQTRMKVIGEHGVFVVDLHNSQSMLQREGSKISRKIAGYAHYWAQGTEVIIGSEEMKADLSGTRVTAKAAKLQLNTAPDWWQQIQAGCGSRQAISWQQYANTYVLMADERTEFFLNDNNQCSYQNLAFAVATQ